MYNFLGWFSKYCPKWKLVLILFRYRWWPIKPWTVPSSNNEPLYEGQRIDKNLKVTVSQILTYFNIIKVGWTSEYFSSLIQVSIPNVEKDKKTGNIHIFKFFKTIDLADIYEYVLDLEAICWSWTRKLWSRT